MAEEMSQQSPDELAKDLPGLPVQLGRVRVDEEGFHRPAGWIRRELHVPWERVTALEREFGAVRVEGFQPNGQAAVLRAPGKRSEAQAVGDAWREYVLRVIEREGALRGTITRHRDMFRPRFWVWGAALAGLTVIFVAATPSLLSVDDPAWLWWMPPLLVIGAVPLAAVAAMRGTRREIGLLCSWSHWELTREGLVFWPNGVRRALSPRAGDVITPAAAVLGGERVRLDCLSGRPVVALILSGLGERAGATVRHGSPVTWIAWLVACGALLAVFAAAGEVDGVIVVAVALVAVSIARYAARREFPLFLEGGRAMLKRLGW